MKPISTWLSFPAFVVLTLLTALLLYPQAEQLDFSTEAIAELVVGSIVGGLFWGAVATWFVRRYITKA